MYLGTLSRTFWRNYHQVGQLRTIFEYFPLYFRYSLQQTLLFPNVKQWWFLSAIYFEFLSLCSSIKFRWGNLRYFFFTAIWNESEMKISHMFKVKLVASLPKKIQQVLSHNNFQLGGKKHLWFLSMTSLKGDYQFYHDARIFS